jgi:polyhydroxybutyrate depolymerase
VPGDHRRVIVVDGRARSYWVHVPPRYDTRRATPVVLAFHGALMNGVAMAAFTGLSAKADEAGFVVAYPNGMGFGEAALFFNASAAPAAAGEAGPPDDVVFTARLLDDLGTVVNVDAKRVFATGLSNGGMMCHRLASELSDRIAAIAPVGGTLALAGVAPRRAVAVIHFHGTADTIVPVDGPRGATPPTMRFRSVADTIGAWVEADGCPAKPVVTRYPDAAPDDGTTVSRTVYGPGRDGAAVVLIEVAGGGHTWPGRTPPVTFIGRSTMDVAANDLLWEFFMRHPLK